MSKQLVIKVGKHQSVEINLLDLHISEMSDEQEKAYKKIRLIMLESCTKIHDEKLINKILPKIKKMQELTFECIIAQD